jgi:hypothetical protein
MMKRRVLFLFLFLPAIACAANVEDVRILNAASGRDNLKLQVQPKSGSSYFFVDIMSSDPEAFEKVGAVVKKLLRGDRYRLDLSIPNFSASPSGSYYRSEDIRFSGAEKK